MFEIFLDFIAPHSYLGVIGLLFAASIGIPIPESISLLIGGFVVYKKEASFLPMFVMCLVFISSVDFALMIIGRYFNRGTITRKLLQKFLTPKNMEKVHYYFEHYGNLTIFLARFFMFIRPVVFVFAGMVKTKIRKFLLLDLSAASLDVATCLTVGYIFGSEIEHAAKVIRKFDFAFFILAALILFLYIWIKSKHLKRTADPIMAKTYEESKL